MGVDMIKICRSPRRSVYFTCIGDVIIFLDSKADEYFYITVDNPDKIITILNKLASRECEGDTFIRSELLSEINSYGVQISREIISRLVPCQRINHPTADIFGYRGGCSVKTRFLDYINLICAIVKVKVYLKIFSLDEIFERLRRRRIKYSNSYNGDVSVMQIHIEKFLKIRPMLYEIKGRCLLDSLVIIEYLAFYKFYPNLVIGVSVNPFEAHAWVQADEYLLNDEFGRAALRQPIMLA